MPATKNPAPIKLPAALLADAVALADADGILDVNSPWAQDFIRDVRKAARSTRFFGSFPRDRVITWATGLGYDTRRMAAVLQTLVAEGVAVSV